MIPSGERISLIPSAPSIGTTMGLLPRMDIGVALEVVCTSGGVAAVGKQADMRRWAATTMVGLAMASVSKA